MVSNTGEYEEVNPYSIVRELVSSFNVTQHEDGSIDIRMHVDKRYAALVWHEICALATTPEEFAKYVKDE